MGFETCGPNEVMVVSGCCYETPLKITGGRVWVWGCCQQVQRLSLNTMTVIITSPNIYTKLGVRITVTGVAQVKVAGQNEEMLTRAVEQFLGKAEDEIQRIAQETLEGHQRAIMGNMTVEEIYKDRKKFSQAVFDVASSDLVNMGIQVVSYTLKDVTDSEGYLKALGMPRTAQVQRDARIGEAEARRDAGIRQAVAFEAQMASKFANDVDIEKAKRDFALQQATFDQEVQTRKAQAELAYALQAAKTKQKIREEEMQIKVVERSQQIQVQEQEIVRRERELDAKVRKPADAETYRVTTLAEANRNRVVMEAQARAEAVRLRGEAEAEAILQKARAAAEQMEAKAGAWQEYESAARLGMFLEKLPQLANEVSKPLNETKKITLISSGKGDVGAAKMSGEVIDIVERMPLLIKSLTGFDLEKAVAGTDSDKTDASRQQVKTTR